MFCVFELTAMKDKVVCVPSECGNDPLNPFFEPTYGISLGRHDTNKHSIFCVYIYIHIFIFIYLYVYLYLCTHTHTHKLVGDDSSCIWKNEVGYRCTSIRIQSLTFQH